MLEKRKLMHQWNNSLIGMRRRDEAYSAMLTARKLADIIILSSVLCKHFVYCIVLYCIVLCTCISVCTR